MPDSGSSGTGLFKRINLKFGNDAMRDTSHLRAGGDGKGNGIRRYAPLLAMAGAGIPWVAYDQLIEDTSDFWTFRGIVFMATAVLGVISVALAWECCHSEGGKSETGWQDDVTL